MAKVVKREDPFSNAHVLSFLIFCIVLQKYIVQSIVPKAMKDGNIDAQTLVVMRQTILAIEMLFIIIPIRHNFSLDHIET